MVSNPPTIQTLPTLVVGMIIEYLEGRSRRSFYSNIDDHNMFKEVLTPLTFVSERWRTAALYSICDNCTLKYDYFRKTIEVGFPAWPAGLSCSFVDKHCLVKHVIVKVATWADSRDSAFSETFDKPQYESLVFPSATTMELHLGRPLYDAPYLDLEAAEEQAASFASSLLCLVPAAANINIMIHFSEYQATDYHRPYSALLYELCQPTTKELRIVSKYRQLPLSFDLRNTSVLTSITHDVSDHYMAFAVLAYQNASTLETLRIRLEDKGKSWLGLLDGGTKRPAVYSRLAVLNIHITEDFHIQFRGRNWERNDDVEPFPSLSELVATGHYRFADDVLFRGNGKSMQILNLPFSAIDRNALGEFKVLERDGVSRMSRVCIGRTPSYDYGGYLAEPQASLIRLQVHSILETATTLEFWNDTSGRAIIAAIASAPGTAILQRLDIGNMALDAAHIIWIVSAIPSLVVITCDISEAGTYAFYIPVPMNMHNRYNDNGLLDSCFRKLCVPNTTTVSGSRIANVAMAVAAKCPSLVHVDMPLKLRKEFSRRISRTGQLNGGTLSRLAFPK
ncbi:hypothetical protein IWW38_002685 [Coemansia aciculifera]|uniref:Uncharacterized protein n=1 Tax=Coemansia aciculifera TaxID=417176 RepID=A0ACC1M4N2_9FUNG|nr:hypothetical protein IWW38_002685 [Coemansia aciculifera]